MLFPALAWTTRKAASRALAPLPLHSRRRVLGPEHFDTLASMDNLGVVRQALGDLQGDQDLHQQALTARRRVLGDDHPHTLASMHNLATVRRDLGDLKGPMTYSRRA